MLKHVLAASVLMLCCLGVVLADTIKGAKITKIDGDKVTVEHKVKKEVKTTEVNVKDAKVCEGKDKTPVADGLKALKVDQIVTIEHTDGKATEIILKK